MICGDATVSAGGREYPVYLPPLRPLTVPQEQAAVAEHVAALLLVLVELETDRRGHFTTALSEFSAALQDSSRRLVGAAAAFVPPYQVLAALSAVVDAHPEAAQQLAGQLAPKES